MTTRGSSQGWLDAKSVLRNQPQSIDHVLGILGIDGRVIGGEMSACCPLHNDRRPSFSINLETGLWICHAGCGAGSVAGLVAEVTGVRFRRAKRWLQGVALEERPDDDDDEGYDEDEGWNEAWCFRRFIDPPEFALKERGISSQAAADLGILWDEKALFHAEYHGFHHGFALKPDFTSYGAWILPIRHPDTHDLLGWQTKILAALDDDTRTTKGTKKSRSLFGIDRFTPGSPVILVESPLDVAVLRTAGFPALASFGANVSRRQRKLLAERASRIFIAMDNDDAGRKSYHTLIQAPEFTEKELLRFNYSHVPKAKDPGDMLNSEIREALRTAKRIIR